MTLCRTEQGTRIRKPALPLLRISHEANTNPTGMEKNKTIKGSFHLLQTIKKATIPTVNFRRDWLSWPKHHSNRSPFCLIIMQRLQSLTLGSKLILKTHFI